MRGDFKGQAASGAVPSGLCSRWRGSAFCTAKAERAKNAYGCSLACAIDLAMRYVVVIAAITFFLIWDGLYTQGRYLDSTVRGVSHVVRSVTG